MYSAEYTVDCDFLLLARYNSEDLWYETAQMLDHSDRVNDREQLAYQVLNNQYKEILNHSQSHANSSYRYYSVIVYLECGSMPNNPAFDSWLCYLLPEKTLSFSFLIYKVEIITTTSEGSCTYWWLCQLPAAAVMNYHKSNDLRQHTFMITVVRVRLLKVGFRGLVKVSASLCSSWRLWGRIRSLPFLVSRDWRPTFLGSWLPPCNGITLTSASVVTFPLDADGSSSAF